MKQLALLALLFAIEINSHHIPVGVTVGLTPYSHPVSSLYHAQDNYGQYVYGYSTPTSSKTETKTADGVTQGGYSYIDSDGILQTVQYVADPVHGFRVAATNLPKDLPDVAYAKARHLAEFEAVKAEHAQIAAQRTVQYTNPIAVPIHAVPHVNIVDLPQPVQDLPEVVKARAEHLAAFQAAQVVVHPQPVQDLPEVIRARAEHLAAVEETKARNAALSHAVSLSPIPEHIASSPVVPVHYTTGPAIATAPAALAHSVSYTPAVLQALVTSQYHAQDEIGQYSYGYVGPLSSKAETKTADGVTRGGYSYIDANGILQTVNYISDPVNGFRVAATNLPVAPKTILIPPGPTVVQHTEPVAVQHSAPVAVQHTAPIAVQHTEPIVEKKIVAAAVPAGLYSHDVYY